MKTKLENILRGYRKITRHFTEAQKIILLHSKIMLGGLALVSLAIATALPAHNASATEEFQSSQDVMFTFEPSLSISIDGNLTIDSLTAGNYADSNIIQVTTTSNAIAGYTMSSTVGNSSHQYSTLLNTSDNSSAFTNLTGNVSTLASFSDSNWGYSWCSGECDKTTSASSWVSGATGSTSVGYNGLPLCTESDVTDCSGVQLVDAASSGSTIISFKIGAKASSTQVAGTYQNVVNFVSVANPNPMTFDVAYALAGKSKTSGYYTMQDMTSDICSAVDDLATGTLIDIRDNNTYTVAKIDGTCWMTKNLDLAGGTTLTSEYSNVSSSYTLPSSSISGWTSNTTAYVYNSGRTDCSSNLGCYSYYSYIAACAGNNPSSGNCSQDICPKGWRLPNITEATAIKNSYPTGAEVLASPFCGTLGGAYCCGTSWGFGDRGSYRTSAAYSSARAYVLYIGIDDSNLTNVGHTNKMDGRSVRCVAQ